MINFPIDLRQYNVKLHDGFLGRLDYNFNSKIPFSMQYEEKKPHKYFINQILPPPVTNNSQIFKVFDDGNIFLYGNNKKEFSVFGSETYSFLTKYPAEQIKFIENQIFIKTRDRIHSVRENLMQTICLPSIDMDTSALTKEVFLLENDSIEIINGTSFPIKCKDPQKILILDNPREVLVFTKNDGYHVDLRQKNIIKRVFSSSSRIIDVRKQKDKIIVKCRNEISVLKDLSYDFTSTISLNFRELYKLESRDNEILLYTRNNFQFFDINNLMRKESVIYNIDRFLGTTGYKNKFYFFSAYGVVTFDDKGRSETIIYRLGRSYLKNIDSRFFTDRKGIKFESEPRNYKYADKNYDFKSELFDSIMNEIEDERKEELERITPTQIISQVKRKQKRSSGF